MGRQRPSRNGPIKVNVTARNQRKKVRRLKQWGFPLFGVYLQHNIINTQWSSNTRYWAHWSKHRRLNCHTPLCRSWKQFLFDWRYKLTIPGISNVSAASFALKKKPPSVVSDSPCSCKILVQFCWKTWCWYSAVIEKQFEETRVKVWVCRTHQ